MPQKLIPFDDVQGEVVGEIELGDEGEGAGAGDPRAVAAQTPLGSPPARPASLSRWRLPFSLPCSPVSRRSLVRRSLPS